MGRVAKYKKIKACDPYSKKNAGKLDLSTVGIWGLGDDGRKKKKRSKTSERLRSKKIAMQQQTARGNNNKNKDGKKSKNNTNNSSHPGGDGFDLPPDEAGDEFDLRDLTGSVKRQQLPVPLQDGDENGSGGAPSSSTGPHHANDATHSIQEDRVVTSTGTVASIPKTERDEAKVNRLLNLDRQATEKEERKKLEGHARMEGESKRAYAKRTRAETRQIIKKTTMTKNVEKLQRKREFLKNKKKNKRKGGASTAFGDDGDNDDNYGEEWGTPRQSESASSLMTGERAVAAIAADPVRFGEQAERPPVFRQLPRGARQSKGYHSGPTKTDDEKSRGMTNAQVEAEKDAMERMRARVQAQYSAIKLKRRLAGDFHL